MPVLVAAPLGVIHDAPLVIDHAQLAPVVSVTDVDPAALPALAPVCESPYVHPGVGGSCGVGSDGGGVGLGVGSGVGTGPCGGGGWGEGENALSCLTVTTCPPIVTVASRDPPLFVDAVSVTLAGPADGAGPTVIHATSS